MKKSSIRAFIKLGINHPHKLRTIGSAAAYAAKYGLVGLRHRIGNEIWLDRVEEPVPADEAGSLAGGISFSILIPTYNVDIKWLEKAVNSVKLQTYSNWEICIADDASSSKELREYIKSLESEKIKVKLLQSNSGISKATNAAAAMATGDYVVLLDDDDELKLDALFELFLRASTGHSDIIYSDNDVIDAEGNRLSVLYKPDWSPDLMRCQMYVGHLLAFKKPLFDSVGGFRSEFDGSQDYDLFLRMASKANSIDHISKVLYSWRSLPSSTATNPDAKPYAQIAGRKAIQSYLDEAYGNGCATVCETDNLFVYDVRYQISSGARASIIIPTKDHVDDLKTAIDSILQKTLFSNYEIIIVDNNSDNQETLDYFESLVSQDKRVSVIKAPIPFNWSKLNNLAAEKASGDVLVFLNNDTEVISPDWLDRLVENAMRDEIGAVGGLLLYPDGLIQHAGVVIGMGGWADHVYKGHEPVHYGSPFISPMVVRDVSAVTGACMAISRRHFDELGGFNESFIVCGSDVELCLHARKLGLYNLYLPQVRLKHFESKTRDARDIPEVDFQLSDAMYAPYRREGDPFYNKNLDYKSCSPTPLSSREKLKRKIGEHVCIGINEIRPLKLGSSEGNRPRLNLLLPSVNPEDIYGGISTALKFFESMIEETGFDARIIVLDSEPRFAELGVRFAQYKKVGMGVDSAEPRQLVSVVDRESAFLPWGDRDRGVCTCWWSAFCMQEGLKNLENEGRKINPIIYLIQDYEPGFYAWSSRYLLADSTYKSSIPTIAVFNSSELKDYFADNGYSFESEFTFEPSLNTVLADKLHKLDGKVAKRRQILVYGRPNTDRNAFELVVEMLRRWVSEYEESAGWDFISAGEEHEPIYLSKGRYLTSVGKLSLSQYADVLAESSVGISLMVSPHPSYPPLEMAAFGVRVITNGYRNKDLSAFSDDIRSISSFSLTEVVEMLHKACGDYSAEVPCGNVPNYYLERSNPFPFMSDLAEKVEEGYRR